MEYTTKYKKKNSKKKVIIIWSVVILAIALGIVGRMVYYKYKGITISNSDVTVKKYLKVKPDYFKEAEVSDNDVDGQISNILNEHQIEQDITDRESAYGDYALVDYKVYQNDKIVEGGDEVDKEVFLNEYDDDYVPGFVDGIVGHEIGDNFQLELTFPENFKVKSLSKSSATFDITIKRLYNKVTPELTDDFVANNIDGCKTVDEFKNKTKIALIEQNEKKYEEQRSDSVWQKVVKNSKVKKYPKDELELKKKQFETTYKRNASEAGLSYDDYLLNTFSMSRKKFTKTIAQAAKDKIKQNFVAKAIADKEGIKLSDKEFDKEIKAMAKQSGYSSYKKMMDDYKNEMTEEDYHVYFLMKKVVKFLYKHANK